MGQLDQARRAFCKAAALDARHLQAQLALAAVSLELGDAAAALESCTQAIALAPNEPKVWFSLAVAQEAANQREVALQSYDQVLALQPAFFDALNNRGVLLLALGRFRDAVDNNRTFATKQPYSSVAQFRLGESLIAARDYAAASQALKRALQLSPNDAQLLLHAGFSLAQCERFSEAQGLLDRAWDIDPEMVGDYRMSIFGEDSGVRLDARTLFLLRHYDAIERCDWQERSYLLERFGNLLRGPEGGALTERALAFRAMALGLDSSLQLNLAKQVAASYLHTVGLTTASPDASPTVLNTIGPVRHSKRHLRIAYLSGDYRLHATAWLMSRMPGLHDRDRFEVLMYSTGSDDGSELRSDIVAGADCFVDAQHYSDMQLASRIAEDKVDILVDLAGYTQHSRPGVLALRSAPLQLSYLAYLQTSGAEWLDYAILDHQVLTPATREFWVEKIAYLPHTLYLCNDRQVNPVPVGSRADEGLPEDAFVFCCLNAPWKIEPDTFACWAEILRRMPNAVLWLYADREEVEINLREAGRAAGIGSGRLFFAKKALHEQHLGRYKYAKVFLDTFSCNAHTTAIEALAAGVPVVTLRGKTVVSRVGASLLMAHGLGELVTDTPSAYVDIACKLAGDPAYFRAVKARVMNYDASRLFSTAQRVREIETAYRMMWARHSAGLSPDDFDVPAIVTDEFGKYEAET